MNLAGRDLTDHLLLLLQARIHQFSTATERETPRSIEEAMCYVAENFETEMESSVSDPTLVERTYQLPDEQVIMLGNERGRDRVEEEHVNPFVSTNAHYLLCPSGSTKSE